MAGLLAAAGCGGLPAPITPSAEVAPHAPLLRPFADGINWVLAEDMIYDRGDGWPPIVVRRGFVTDLTSIPRSLQSLVSAVGAYSRAAIVHDYLYWTQSCSQEEADHILYYAMNDSRVPPRQQWTIYRGVRARGSRSFAENGREKKSGLAKVLPDEPRYWAMVDQKSWAAVRQIMKAEGRQDPPSGDNGYCGLGRGGSRFRDPEG